MLDGEACPYPRFRCAKPAGHKGAHKMRPADRKRDANGTRRNPGSARGASDRRARPARSSSAGRSRAGSAPPVMAGVLSMAWAAIGMRVEQSMPEPVGPPVGRVMQFQAIDAGAILHRLLSSVPAYRKLAAVAGAGGGASDEIVALLGAPLLAAVMATNDAAKLMLWPVFADVIKASAVSIAKAQKEQLDAMVTVNEYQEQVDEMMAGMQDGLFAPGPNAEEHPHDEAAPDA